jgi:hypothetical protein
MKSAANIGMKMSKDLELLGRTGVCAVVQVRVLAGA